MSRFKLGTDSAWDVPWRKDFIVKSEGRSSMSKLLLPSLTAAVSNDNGTMSLKLLAPPLIPWNSPFKTSSPWFARKFSRSWKVFSFWLNVCCRGEEESRACRFCNFDECPLPVTAAAVVFQYERKWKEQLKDVIDCTSDQKVLFKSVARLIKPLEYINSFCNWKALVINTLPVVWKKQTIEKMMEKFLSMIQEKESWSFVKGFFTIESLSVLNFQEKL